MKKTTAKKLLGIPPLTQAQTARLFGEDRSNFNTRINENGLPLSEDHSQRIIDIFRDHVRTLADALDTASEVTVSYVNVVDGSWEDTIEILDAEGIAVRKDGTVIAVFSPDQMKEAKLFSKLLK